jgi:putative transposase
LGYWQLPTGNFQPQNPAPMPYDPKIHHRRSIRLKNYDYSRNGAYFITACCQFRQYRFGYVKDHKMILSECGQIAHDEWVKLADRFKNVEFDVFQIMPDHMHGIISINRSAEAGPSPTVGDIVGAYKSLVVHECLKLFNAKQRKMGKFWQRNYYEIIIRDARAYHNISNYIFSNPEKFENKKFF